MAPRTSLKISNGRLITPKGITSPGSLLIAGGQIASWSEGDLDAGDVPVLDARGLYVAPGFVDIHIHGMGGYDFMDQDVEGFREISRLLPRYGTTAIFPTTLTGSTEETLSTLSVYQKAIQSLPAGAEFMGIHLEGPYFAMNQRGAQDPRYIRNPDPAEYHLIIESSPHIRRWSAAPELPGFIPFAQFAVSKGLVVSMAHTDAIYEEVWAAYEAGCRLATHLYSGMSGVTRRNAYRYAGAVESALLLDDMVVEVIADGKHLPAPLLQLIYKIKGPQKIALVTDSMRAAGLPPGESVIGNRESGMRVIVEDGVSKLPDRSAFAGSVATADLLVRNMIQLAKVPLEDAVQMMTLTPASAMHVSDHKGSLEIGKDADLTIFDEDISIYATIVAGKVVYQKGSQHFR